MVWRFAAGVLAAGCSFEPPLPCATPARPLVEVNSPAEDRSPWISPDGLELYFSSTRSGDSEIYRAVRGSTREPFSPPALVPSLSTPDLDFDPVISDDGLTAWTFREHTSFLQLFTYHRADRASAWGPAEPVTDIEGRHPSFTADMLTVYTASLHLTPTEDIFVATRARTSDPFDPPTVLPISTDTDDQGPSISGDGDTLLAGTRALAPDQSLRLARAVRTDGMFSPFEAILAPEGAGNDRDPMQQRGGTAIVFASDRSAGQGDLDIWIACEAP